MIKEIIINAEQIFAKEPLTQAATAYKDPEQLQGNQLQLLSTALKELIHQETQRIANTG